MRENMKKQPGHQSAARRAAANAQPARGARTGYAVKNRKSKKARRQSSGLSANVKTALWLWFPPMGLYKMWQSACTWRRGVKIGITAAMAVLLGAILLIPTPKTAVYETGVQMMAAVPEVEVYGPALPAVIMSGYTTPTTNSVIVDQVSNDVHYVYAADGAECYHEYECKFAFASSQRLTVYEAYHLGFRPCGRCNPPVYVPGVTDPITAQPKSGAVATTVETTEATADAQTDTQADAQTAVQ